MGMAEISYPADWRDIPPDRWARMMMTPEQYTAMRAGRLVREEAAPEVGDIAPDFRPRLRLLYLTAISQTGRAPERNRSEIPR